MADYELGMVRTARVASNSPSHQQHLRQLPKPGISRFLILGVLGRVQAKGIERDLLKRMGKKAVGSLRILA